MNEEKLRVSETTDGKPARPGFESASAPSPINPNTGQHESYWVLSEEERLKGFVRPVRLSYKHVGYSPKHPLRDLTDDERQRYAPFGYVKFEMYPDSESCVTGRFWTQAELDRTAGCGVVTRMGVAIAETYARDPHYYGSTFCCGCGTHRPVSEFVWDDGSGCRVGE